MQTQYEVPQRQWIESTKKSLDSLDSMLTRTEKRLSNAAADVDEEIRARVVTTRAKLSDWQSRWNDARETAADVWDTVGEEMATAWKVNRTAFENSLEEIEEALDGVVPNSVHPDEGDTVFVHYTGRLSDGTEFQSTLDRDPIEFVLGEAKVLAGVEKAVSEMHIGEEKTVRVQMEKGFGPRDESLVFEVSRDLFTNGEVPALGDRATVHPKDGEPIAVTIRRVKGETIEVDANHPLAGHDLEMELKLVGIS